MLPIKDSPLIRRDHPYNAIVQLLEQARRRPLNFLPSHVAEEALAYLSGLESACWALTGEETDLEVRRCIVERRGWKWAVAGEIPQMRAAGLSEEQMVDELFVIELECWRHRLFTSREIDKAGEAA